MSNRRGLLPTLPEHTESSDEDSDEEPIGSPFSLFQTAQTDVPKASLSFLDSSDEESEDETIGGQSHSSGETLIGKPSMSAQTDPSVRPKVRQPMARSDFLGGLEWQLSRSTPSPSHSVETLAQRLNLKELYGEDLHGPGGAPMQFKWDHFGSEFQPKVEMPGLEWISGGHEDPGFAGGFMTIMDDVTRLQNVGLIIDYPNGLLGEGLFGAVYAGTYGPEAKDLPEVSGKTKFAVKVVDFGTKRDRETLEKRELYENEKYILTNVHHKNVVAVRMIINMGTQRSFAYLDNPKQRYISPERVYLIMDFAEEGELEQYLNRHNSSLETYVVINFIRDLFAGMLYLHSNEICHSDVHTGNVLLFTEGDEIVAKWADFGMGYVGSNKQYRFKQPEWKDMDLKVRRDMINMEHVFTRIIYASQCYAGKTRKKTLRDSDYAVYAPKPTVAPKQPTEEESRLFNELDTMLNLLKKAYNLMEVYEQCKHILEEELVLESEHY